MISLDLDGTLFRQFHMKNLTDKEIYLLKKNYRTVTHEDLLIVYRPNLNKLIQFICDNELDYIITTASYNHRQVILNKFAAVYLKDYYIDFSLRIKDYINAEKLDIYGYKDFKKLNYNNVIHIDDNAADCFNCDLFEISSFAPLSIYESDELNKEFLNDNKLLDFITYLKTKLNL